MDLPFAAPASTTIAGVVLGQLDHNRITAGLAAADAMVRVAVKLQYELAVPGREESELTALRGMQKTAMPAYEGYVVQGIKDLMAGQNWTRSALDDHRRVAQAREAYAAPRCAHRSLSA